MEADAIGRSAGAGWDAKGPSQKGPSHPVDLVHLSRYTLGERALEREVLELFCTQSAVDLERLRQAPSDRQWQDAAHSLKGSAQAIGAWRAAAAAARAEALSCETFGDSGEARGARLRELESSVHEAEAYIRSLL